MKESITGTEEAFMRMHHLQNLRTTFGRYERTANRIQANRRERNRRSDTHKPENTTLKEEISLYGPIRELEETGEDFRH